MRRILLALLLFFGMTSITPGYAGSKLGKKMADEWKEQVKKLKKEGWAVFGQSQTLEKALEAHYLKVEEAGLGAITINGQAKSNNQNQAVNRSQLHAKAQLNKLISSKVDVENQTKVTNETGQGGTKTTTEFVHLSHSESENFLKNLTPTLILYRQVGEGSFEAMSFYVVIDD